MAKKGKVLQTIIDIAGEISPTLGKSINSVADKLDGLNVKAVAFSAAAATAVAGAAAAFGKATSYLTDLGGEYDAAANSMAASTGLTGRKLEALEEVMQDVYRNQYGETMQEAADGVEEVWRQTKLMGDALQETTEGAFALKETFGYDINESARAAKAMMTNFGVSGEDAMGLIAAGAQNGLDYSGELIDSISEYSVQFAKLGFSADEMFHIFQQGADSGAWSLDKVSNAIKEFSIHSIDGSKGTKAAFKALGLNANDMMETFAAGGDHAEASFRTVLKRLMAMEDQVERDAVGVALFGTMWEDLGTSAMSTLADASSTAYDAADAMGKINAVKYDSLNAAMEGIKRNTEVQLIPAAEAVTDAFIDIAPKIEGMVNTAMPYIVDLAESIGPAITAAVELAEDGFGWLAENGDDLIPIVSGLTAAFVSYKAAMAISGTINAVKKAMDGMTFSQYAAATAQKALNAVMSVNPIYLVAAAIGALVAAGVWLYQNWDMAKAKCEEFGARVQAVWFNVNNAVTGFIAGIGEKFPIFAGYLSGLWTSVFAIAENIKGIFSGIIDFIGNVFSGNWSAAWENVVSIFANLFGGIVNMAKMPINGVVGAINAVIDGINGAGFSIPDWIPVVGGKSFSLNIPKIPMLATGGHTDGVSIAGEDGMETVISYDPAYRAENLSYWAEAGRLLGADWSDFTLGSSFGVDYYDFSGVTFAPNVIVQGNADKQTVMDAIEDEYPEFCDMLERFIRERGKPVYA